MNADTTIGYYRIIGALGKASIVHIMAGVVCLFVVLVFRGTAIPQIQAQETPAERSIIGNAGLAPYIRGVSYYGMGEYLKAERAFLESLRLTPYYTGARYWLGMCYYKQNRLDDAKASFQSLTGIFSTHARAYDGLGLVYLKEPDRTFEALAAFRKAAYLDPYDAEIFYHTGLTYLRLMKGNHLDEYLYSDKARRAFKIAIELNPYHPDAYYRMGGLYDKSTRTFSIAVTAYEQQIEYNPFHDEAIRALANLHSNMGHYQEALATFEHLIQVRKYATPYVLRDMALAVWRAKDRARAEKSFERLFPRLLPAERALYTDLTLVAGDEEADRFAAATDEEKQRLWQDFWAIRDPVPATPENERLIEHYARVAFARKAYGQHKFPWDRRGEILIRYGRPDRILPIRGSKPFAPGPFIVSNPAWISRSEVWTYNALPMTLKFENKGTTRAFDYPEIFPYNFLHSGKITPGGIVRATSVDHPYFVSRRMIDKTPEYYFPYELGRPLAFLHDAVVFRDGTGTPELEIAVDVKQADIGLAGVEINDLRLYSGVVLHGSDWKRVAVDSSEASLYSVATDPPGEHAVAIRTVSASPGAYHVAVQLRDRVSQKFGVSRSTVRIPSFDTPGLKMSGLRLASDIRSALSRQDGPTRHDVRIVPNPSHAYARGEPVYFYFEVYDLTPDVFDRSRYQIDILVSTAPDTSLQDRNIFWEMMAGVEKVFRKVREQTVTLTFETVGRSGTAPWYTSLDTGDLTPGFYKLGVTITDLATRNTVSRDQVFRIERSP